MPSSTITSSLRSQALPNGYVRRFANGVAATLVVALAAHLVLPLPFTPVPFSMQPLAVLTVGLLLGPVDGALVMLAYLLEGAVGLPVFSPTGPGGLLQLLGPTGGYLIADPVVAFIAGVGAKRLGSVAGLYWAAVLAGVAATAVLFTSGAAWLAHLHPAANHTVWLLAIGPFLPGEAVKILIAAGIYRTFSSSFPR